MENKETVVYIQINDWNPKDYEIRFLTCYLSGSLTMWDVEFPEGVVNKTADEEEKWMIDNKLCVNEDLYDLSTQYWITTTKEWVEKNFPEMLPYVSETPKDWLYKGDRKYFLKYMPENYGYHFATTMFDDETDDYLEYNRFALPELFK